MKQVRPVSWSGQNDGLGDAGSRRSNCFWPLCTSFLPSFSTHREQVTYWNESKKSECGRISSQSKCFCGHKFLDHPLASKKSANPKCMKCPCKRYAFIPQRPEEVGMYWLVRRKDFNVNAWRAKCKCQHNHEEHACNAPYNCKKCSCFGFNSDFAYFKSKPGVLTYDGLFLNEQLHFLRSALGRS